jgi:putative heme-binding domain-containing protein
MPGSQLISNRFLRIALLVLAAFSFIPSLVAQEHAGQYSQADIERGARIYNGTCAACHGPNGDAVAGVNFRSGKFRRAESDEQLQALIGAGIAGTAMPATNLDERERAGIVAFLRTMGDRMSANLAQGDAARGKQIFDGKGGCTGCHRVAGQGSRLGPDLTDVGLLRTTDMLTQKLADPTGTMQPVNRSIRAVMADGKVITGRRLNEDTFTVQVMDEHEVLRNLDKSTLKQYTVLKTSTMPSYQDKLSKSEMADVVSYLLTLKGGK